MTTTRRLSPAPPPRNRLQRRVSYAWRTLFTPGDLAILLIAIVLLVMPAMALHASGWPLSLPTTLPVIVLSVLFGFLLARSHFNELFALGISGLYGLSFVLLIAAFNEPGGLGSGMYSIFQRIIQWLVDATTGGINQDDLVFTLLVATLFWFLGYNASWHIFRVDRVWRVILPPGLILATNSVFYNGDAQLDIYLLIFLFLALLLIVRSNLDAREWEWYVNGIRVPRTLRQQFLRIGAALALIALVVGWGIPTGNLQEQLNRFQTFLQSDPLAQLSELWNRLFSPIDSEGPATTDYYGARTLQLGGAIRLGEQIVFVVSAPPDHRYYWRSRVYDIYDRGWSPNVTTLLTTTGSPLEIPYPQDTMGGRELVQQEFTMALSASRLVYAAPQPLEVDLPTKMELRYIGPESAERAMNISVIYPLKVIYRGDSYRATSMVSTATAFDLRAAPAVYPDWVREIYIDAPLPITERTRQLARRIVDEAGVTTPYDRAKAIETWLRTNIAYNEAIPQPPPDQDPIDWALFDLRQGYCKYYASAMIVMLRSLGIPARMAAGFAQGTWDADNQHFVVKERDAHTWVEVFFPAYGWIEFEPTAAQAPITRIGDEQIPPQPSPQPLASPTPTATFTPIPSPTQDPNLPQQQNPALPTITPTFTPSPTATPVIVPTLPPPVRPQPRGFLSFLLPALGIAFLVLFLIILLVAIGIFLWWWLEWRGLKGLNPVVRAYAKLERFVSLIGIRLAPQETPEERRRRILRELPGSERPVTAITRLYTTERYGRTPKPPVETSNNAQIAERAWSEARAGILQRMLWRLLPWRR